MANTMKFGNGQWATQKDSILAFNDENANFKPLPFTASRASTATRVNKLGLIETVGAGIPRVDYLGNTKGAYLLEPQRTNLYSYSNKFDVFWSKTNLSAIPNSIISLDGNLNGYFLRENTANGSHDIRQNATVVSGSKYTYSVFVKKSDAGQVRNLSFYIGGPNGSISFNTSDGTFFSVGSVDNYASEDYGNGWWRLQFTDTAVSASFNVILILNNASTIYQGDGVSGVYIYGAQLEQSSYATSYIPTAGGAVTRLADTASQTVPDGIIGQSEGTMFFDIDFANTSGVVGAWSISNGSSANRITMNTVPFSSTKFTLSIAQNYNSGSTKLASTNVTLSDKHKVAIKYFGTTLKLFVDGQLEDSVSTDGFGNYTKFYLGANQVGVGGDTRKFIQANLYNTALTDAELAKLTKI